MVNVTLPNGEVVQMPANSAARVYAAQTRAQTQAPSTDPKEMYGRRLAYLLQCGIDPSSDTQLQQITQAQLEFTAKPPADTATAAKSAYMGIIGKMQAAGALPPDYLAIEAQTHALRNARYPAPFSSFLRLRQTKAIAPNEAYGLPESLLQPVFFSA